MTIDRYTSGERARRRQDADALDDAGRLLTGGRYREAAAMLSGLQCAETGARVRVAGEIIHAAREIALACLERHSEAERHRTAARDATDEEGPSAPGRSPSWGWRTEVRDRAGAPALTPAES